MSSADLQSITTLFKEYFFNRTDLLPILADYGKPVPAKSNDLDALIAAHVLGEKAPPVNVSYETRKGSTVVQGHFRIGSYTPVQRGKIAVTKWLCIDIDGRNHKDGVTDPLYVVDVICWKFKKLQLYPFLEKSASSCGWHIWIFFSEPISAHTVRTLAQKIVPNGHEIFPKQDKAYKGTGNMVWLPWWQGANEGGNQFYEVNKGIESWISPKNLISTLQMKNI